MNFKTQNTEKNKVLKNKFSLNNMEACYHKNRHLEQSINPRSYIDPGTGSMLFSLILGTTASLYFSLRTFALKLKLFITGGRGSINRNCIPIVIYSEGKQYWSVFKPVLEEFDARNVPVIFYTSSKDDPFFENSYQYVQGNYIGEKNAAFWKLAFIQADICLMTTPGLDVLQLKRSKHVKHYSHILHSVSDTIGYRLFSLDYYDSVLLTGEYQIKNVRKLEQLRKTRKKELEVVGCTYLDEMSTVIKDLEKKNTEKFTVLVAPSWGENAILSRFGEQLLDPLIQNDWDIIIRPHLQSKIVENNVLEKLQKRYKEYKNVEWDYNVNNYYSMNKADIMISDFSGIIFDFCFLFNKPFLYANQKYNQEIYDAGDLNELPMELGLLDEIGFELTDDNFSKVGSVIDKVINNSGLEEQRDYVKNILWQNRQNSAKTVVDFLIKKQKEVSS